VSSGDREHVARLSGTRARTLGAIGRAGWCCLRDAARSGAETEQPFLQDTEAFGADFVSE
jgi:hypothetical protein